MKKNLKNLDFPLLICTLLLTIFGLVMIFSASSIAAVLQYGQTGHYFFKKQLIVVIMGFIVASAIICIPTKNYKVLSRLAILAIMGVLLSLKTYGIVANSARSWFKIFGFSLQPSEFAKTFIILYLACAYGEKRKYKTIYDLFIPLVPCVIIFGFVVLEPDLGTAIIIAIICMFIFFSLPIEKNKVLNIVRVLAFVGILFAVVTLTLSQEYLTDAQASRFNFKKPCERYLEETGYQVCNGYIAMHNGGVFGVGLGNSAQKYLYLPEAYSDFIFPIVVEETGIIGGTIVIIFYIFILLRILIIARNASSLRGSIIAFGTFALIFTHICVNMGGLLALIPLTGVPLPFLSYGGSFMLNLIVLLALTQRVAIESKETQLKREVRKVVG